MNGCGRDLERCHDLAVLVVGRVLLIILRLFFAPFTARDLKDVEVQDGCDKDYGDEDEDAAD